MRYGVGFAVMAAVGLMMSPAPALSQMGGSPGGAAIESEIAPRDSGEMQEDESVRSPEQSSAPTGTESQDSESAAKKTDPYGGNPPEQEEAE